MLKISITLKNLFSFSKFNQLKDLITEETTVHSITIYLTARNYKA